MPGKRKNNPSREDAAPEASGKVLGPKAAALIFAAAAAIRSLYLLEIRHIPFFSFPVVDAKVYLGQARAIAHGYPAGSEAFWQAPLYPYLLAAGIAILGERHFLLHLIQSLAGAANCSLVALLGARTIGRREGIIAGLIAAVYGPLIFFDGEYLIPTLLVSLNLLLLLSIIEAGKAGKRVWIAAAGLLLGLSAIARPNALAFAPVAAIWPAYAMRSRFSLGGIIRRMAIMAIAALIPIIPVTAHNKIASDDFVLISYNGGINFYLGNNENWRETSALRPGLEWADLRALPLKEGAARPSERSAWFFRKSSEYVMSHPFKWICSLAVRTGQFFHGHEYARNLDLYSRRSDSKIISALLWEKGIAFPYGIIAPLALLGAGLSIRNRSRERTLLLLYSATYAAAVILFFVTARYRAPVLPVMFIFAAASITWMADKARERKLKRLAAAAAVTIVLVAACNYGLGRAARPPQSEAPLFLGHAYYDMERWDDAIREYEKALSLDPDSPEKYIHLGAAYREKGQKRKAAYYFRQAIGKGKGRRTMANAWAHEFLGDLMLESKDFQEARRQYEASLACNEYQFGARRGLAKILAVLGDKTGARENLTRLADQYPRRPEPWRDLAFFELMEGQDDLAVKHLEKSLQFDRDDPETLLQLALLYLGAGETAKARDMAARARAVSPDDPRIKAVHERLSK